MFFIVPSPEAESNRPASNQSTRSGEAPEAMAAMADVNAYYRRRVAAACDRCRLKKARCSGGPAPCTKCKRDRVICVMSKGHKLDTQPKPPAYVRMVESQRDLLLRAVQLLRQKSTECQRTGSTWDATSDINRVLEELGVHVEHPEVVHESIMEELTTPRATSSDDSFPNAAVSQTNSDNKNTASSFNIVANLTSPTQATPNQEGNQLSFQQITPPLDAVFDAEYHVSSKDIDQLAPASQFNTKHSDDPFFPNGPLRNNLSPEFRPSMEMSQTNWHSISSLPFFDFQDPDDLNYLNLDILQQHQA